VDGIAHTLEETIARTIHDQRHRLVATGESVPEQIVMLVVAAG